jgi:arylsulfatase A-like enzyme
MRRPNVLIFCTDQQHANHMGCTGVPFLTTPTIDRIAASGARFASAYSACPVCMPARATMFTGLTPRGNNMRRHGMPLPEDIPTLPGLLADAGYRTHSVGKLHLKPWAPGMGVDTKDIETPRENPERNSTWNEGRIRRSPDNYYGFQTQDSVIQHGNQVTGDYAMWLGQQDPNAHGQYRSDVGSIEIAAELHYNTWIADRSIAFISEQSDAQPFFLWCSFPDPHTPFAALKSYADRYRKDVMPLPPNTVELPNSGQSETLKRCHKDHMRLQARDPDLLRECTRQIFGMITHLDEQAGRVMASLEEKGLTENTVIIWISDHGEQLGEQGGLRKGPFPYDGSTRIPLIISVPWARGDLRGRVINEPVSQIDLVPTVLDLVGVSQPEDPRSTPQHRRALAPLCTSLPGESLKPVLLDGASPRRATALVEFDEDADAAFENLQMRTFVTTKYKVCLFSPTGELLLFDRTDDPYEMKNLAAEPEYKDVLVEMLAGMMMESARTEPRLPRRFSWA